MASNPATPFGLEFGNVEELHRDAPPRSERSAQTRSQGPRSAFSRIGVAANETSESPFAALSARHGRPLRVAILSDFTTIPYANGAAFQTRFLYQELRRCGHEVTVIGPRDPHADPASLPPDTVGLPSVPLKTYPGLFLPMPTEAWVYDPSRWSFDIIFAQATSPALHFAVWLRKMKGIPVICVNTTHLSAAYDVLLPENLKRLGWVNAGLEGALKRPVDKHFAAIYNDSDGLVVLSEGLRSYWRERGVTVPIHVIPRTVQPEIFDRPLGEDPYTHLESAEGHSWRGARLLCAGRHTREKSQDRIIRIFARYVAPVDREATLTMLGDGPDREYYERVAQEEGVAHRVFFPGEVPFTKMADYYAYADLFVHGSLSETYGNVMGEALWCGTPTVAFADGMGVSSQIKDRVNGVLLSPGKGHRSEREADATFGRAVLDLLADPEERARLGTAASKMSRERCSPLAVQTRIADAFRLAQEHAAACRINAAADGPRVVQWATTFHHFRSWAAANATLYLVGHLRPADDHSKTKAKLHPQIGS
ncbi:MAG: glycosyltransferase [Labilithrix sp.]|nr:glycosyltransferase [Labilithrix sp.]MCW5813698.1 glycosyltransferase [Labilithrix sp.]